MSDFGSAQLGFQTLNAGTGILGARTQAGAIRGQSEADQANADLTARRLQMQAQDAETRGTQAVRAIGMQANQAEGTARARLASQGIDPNTGSALGAQTDIEEMSELDKLTARNNAAREAYGFNSQALATTEAAKMQAMGARNLARQTILGSYIDGTKDVYTGLYQYKKMGGLGGKNTPTDLFVTPPAGKNMSDPSNR